MAVDYLTALGVGAGIDTNAIVDALVEAERAPKQSSLDRLISKSETRISAYGIVKSTLELVREQFQRLDDVTDVTAFSSQSSNSLAVEATTTSAAQAGSYQLTVSQLADRDSYTFDGFDSKTEVLNDGAALTIRIIQDGASNDVTISNPTLTNIVTAINDSGLGITASVIDTAQPSNRYVLSVSSDTGADNAFTLSSDLLTNEVQQSTAQDAMMTINGIDVVSASNDVSSALTGINLHLKDTFASEQIVVSRDTSVLEGEISSLVDVYNEAQVIFKSLKNGDDPEDDLIGSLTTDSIFRTIESAFRSTFGSPSATASGSISYWSDLGVEMQRDGSLKLNQDRLETALATSYDDVVSALTADTNNQTDLGVQDRGLAGAMSAHIRNMVALSGPLDTAIRNASDNSSDYREELEDLESRMERVRERYVQQFQAMQQIVDQMSGTSDYLKSQFEALNAND